MTDRFITAVSGYIPMPWLDRSAAATGVGRRSVAGRDEDPLTSAVEAARHLGAGSPIDRFIFGAIFGRLN